MVKHTLPVLECPIVALVIDHKLYRSLPDIVNKAKVRILLHLLDEYMVMIENLAKQQNNLE